MQGHVIYRDSTGTFSRIGRQGSTRSQLVRALEDAAPEGVVVLGIVLEPIDLAGERLRKEGVLVALVPVGGSRR